MEIFPYEDWLIEGRRLAKARGIPNFDTESFSLRYEGGCIEIHYSVELKSTGFNAYIESIPIEDFDKKFFALLERQTHE